MVREYDGLMSESVDLSTLHAELDRLKAQLCRCRRMGECMACQGFEVVRRQAQAVAEAASQPVLQQVAQETAVKDMMSRLAGTQEMLAHDPTLQALSEQMMARLQEKMKEEMGSDFDLEKFLRGFGGPGGGGPTPPDDMPRPPHT